QGRKTRSVIVMTSNHVVLSAIHAETISQRFAAINGNNLSTDDDTDLLPE
ncbi:MAG: extracellular matrix/biofilm biosynthesis regulator RemA family protein, partial [Thermodesulfobacteriota bacterium]